MSLAKGDRSLQEELEWAMERLARAGYPIKSKVRLLVDPKLDIMGYANEEGGRQHIVIAEWALGSEMLGGLLFHELAHIYHSERRSPSHKSKVTSAIITELGKREGFNERETAYLAEGFNHLQNVMVDDIVFAAMLEPERRQAQRFFAGWVTEAPSGYPLTDASALARNAFALASLRRHGLLDEADPEVKDMVERGRRLVGQLKGSQEKYDAVEGFLIEADADWDEETFYNKFALYLDLLVALLREDEKLADLR